MVQPQKSSDTHTASVWERFPYVSGKCLARWPLTLPEASPLSSHSVPVDASLCGSQNYNEWERTRGSTAPAPLGDTTPPDSQGWWAQENYQSVFPWASRCGNMCIMAFRLPADQSSPPQETRSYEICGTHQSDTQTPAGRICPRCMILVGSEDIFMSLSLDTPTKSGWDHQAPKSREI